MEELVYTTGIQTKKELTPPWSRPVSVSSTGQVEVGAGGKGIE